MVRVLSIPVVGLGCGKEIHDSAFAILSHLGVGGRLLDLGGIVTLSRLTFFFGFPAVCRGFQVVCRVGISRVAIVRVIGGWQ